MVTEKDLEDLFYAYWQEDVKNGYIGSSRDWMKDNESEVEAVKEFYGVK